MTVQQHDPSDYIVKPNAAGQWNITDYSGAVIAGPFRSNAEAWRWLDRCDPNAVADDEQRKRIGAAIGR